MRVPRPLGHVEQAPDADVARRVIDGRLIATETSIGVRKIAERIRKAKAVPRVRRDRRVPVAGEENDVAVVGNTWLIDVARLPPDAGLGRVLVSKKLPCVRRRLRAR